MFFALQLDRGNIVQALLTICLDGSLNVKRSSWSIEFFVMTWGKVGLYIHVYSALT